MNTVLTHKEHADLWNEIHTLYEQILEQASYCSLETTQRILDTTRNFESIISQFEPNHECFSSLLQGNIGYVQALQQLVVREIIEYPKAKELHRTLSLFLCLSEQQLVVLKESERTAR